MKLNPYKTGLTVGLFVSGLHMGWVLLIVLGWAQPLVNFIFWAHMVTNPIAVTGFDLTNALTLVIVTFLVGFIFGKVFALVWNKVQK